LDLNIKNYGVINLGDIEIWITDTLIGIWIVAGVLIAFAVFFRIKVRTFKEVPTGLQNAVEAIVEAFESYVYTTAGEKLMFLGNWFFTVFIFVLLSNISGIFSMRPPTADWALTVSLAVVTFLIIQAMGVKYRGWGYIKSFFEPMPLFLPINLIGELARPISLSFRLFGNILAGTVMMSLIYSIAPVYTHFVVPVFLHAYFDLFAGVLQTYIFVTLSLSFICGAAEVPDAG